MRKRAAVVASTLLGSAVLLPIGAETPAHAAGSQTSYVTMVSEVGDYVGGGASWIWRPGAGTIGVTGSPSSAVNVSVSGGPSGTGFNMSFAAPQGETLDVGRYEDAERTPFRSAGHPGIDIHGDGRGCNTIEGSFTVLDLAPDLSRLWLVYEQHCEGGDAALFGEIKYGMPAGQADALVAADNLQWPSEYPGVSSRIVPVTVANTSASEVTVSGASIWAGSSDFGVAGNSCGTIVPDATCVVYVSFKPSATGTRRGVLAITVDGVVRRVSLSGDGMDGRTSWTMHSEPGDYIGGGQDWAYTPADATISASGTESYISFSVRGGDDWWDADFEADSGHLLLPGTTFNGATRYPFNSTSTPGMDLFGNGRGCNKLTGSFTVNDASYESGEMTGVSISFEQHCEGGPAALTGTLEWRAGADATKTRSAIDLMGTSAQLTFGSSASLLGNLHDALTDAPLGNEPLYVYSSPHGTDAWRFLKRINTADSGRYSVSVEPKQNLDYRLNYFGSDGHRQAVADKVSVLVSPRVSFAADRTSGPPGTTFTFSATVKPNHEGQKVALQRRENGSWKVVGRQDLSSTSAATFSVRHSAAGQFRYRIRKPADADHVAATSGVVEIQVGR